MRTTLIPALALTLALIAGCESPTDDAKEFDYVDMEQKFIYLGSVPTLPEHDATVSIHSDTWLGWSSAFCTGTLIFDRWVLTAAHCLQGENASNTGVHFGDNSNVGLGNNMHRGTGKVVHNNYNSFTLANDIALLELATPATYAEPVMPLPSSIGLTNGDEGDDLNIAGFGTQENNNYGHLEQVDVRITDVRNKEVEYDQGNGFGNGTGGPCSGDSGGPAFITRSGTPYVAGITSSGDWSCNNYGISTKVDAFETWIENNTGETVSENGGGGPVNNITESFSGTLQTVDDFDGFIYTAGSAGTHTITMTGDAGTDFDLYMAEWDGNAWVIIDSSTAWFTSTESISHNPGSAGTFGVGAHAYSGTGDYDIDVTHPQ